MKSQFEKGVAEGHQQVGASTGPSNGKGKEKEATSTEVALLCQQIHALTGENATLVALNESLKDEVQDLANQHNVLIHHLCVIDIINSA